MRPGLVAFSLLAWTFGLGGQLLLDDPRRRFPTFVLLGLVSVLGWLSLGSMGERGQLRGRALVLTLAAALLFRGWALSLPPSFSEDVFRYVYEGRAAGERGWGFPFAHAPASAPELGLPEHLTDESWRRVNHAFIPTIYPPLSQATFVLAAGLSELVDQPTLLVLKLLLVAAELLAGLLLVWLLLRQGRPIGTVLYLAACPVSVLEIAREGHADSLSVLGLALFCLGFAVERPRRGYVGLALAALAKLNGLVLLPAALRGTRRGFVWAVPLFLLLLLPVLLAGPVALTGLGQYAQRWRAGDGAFSVLLELAELFIGGEFTTVGALVLTRHTLARGLSLLLFAACATAVLWRPAPLAEVPERAGRLLLLLLLLSPTLHPWYTLWLLPFVVYGGPDQRAFLTLLALGWLGHHAAWLDLGRGWVDLPWVRALVHVPVWISFLGPRLLQRSKGGMLRPTPQGPSWDSRES